MQIVENGLIPIYQGENDDRLVDARELHEFLESKDTFSNWVTDKIRQAQLDENTDYIYFTGENPEKGRPSKQVLFTMDAAKHVAMLQSTEKGKQVRKYFIEIEKKSRNPLGHISRKDALRLALEAEERAEKLQLANEYLQRETKLLAPKAEGYDTFLSTESSILLGTFAKVVKLKDDKGREIGRNSLFKILREMGILFGSNNEPKQEHVNAGRFEVRERIVVQGDKREVYTTTLITPKGQDWLLKKLKERFADAG
jgi:anti-repressor protein